MAKQVQLKQNGVEEGIIYAPYLVQEKCATIVNGIKVYDPRWWVNIWCRINWFFHMKERRRFKKFLTKEVDAKYYKTIEV